MKSLDQLAIKYGTDKSSQFHDYCKNYALYFEAMRKSKLTLLELGYGGHEDPYKGGESCHMWHEYFPHAKICCIDNEPKLNIPLWLRLFTGSQDDQSFLDSTVSIIGQPNIIIDDASHLSSLTIASFKILFPLLKAGGYYCIEDLHSSLHSWYYGQTEANENPREGNTALNFFKTITDEVQADFMLPQYRIGYEIESMHFYRDFLIIKKK